MPGSSPSLFEFNVIDVFRQHFPGVGSGVQLGIGDDAAITSLPANCELVTATDALVEGTHFLPGASAESVGHRALAVNLSDIAAMGAEAHWATLSLSLPEANGAWVRQFAEGFARLAKKFDVTLIGGDTVRGPLSATVTAMGSVPAGEFVQRSGAAAGNDVYLSGQPGFAAAGRRLLAGELQSDATESQLQIYQRKFEYPQPRLGLGNDLRGIASAMIDISDGVHVDLGRLLAANKLGAEVSIPDLGSLTTDFGLDTARSLFMAGGEDYELCFCAAPDFAADVAQLSEAHGVPLTRVGVVTEDRQLVWHEQGHPVEIPTSTFEHFPG